MLLAVNGNLAATCLTSSGADEKRAVRFGRIG
jgi:hypothetical protein